MNSLLGLVYVHLNEWSSFPRPPLGDMDLLEQHPFQGVAILTPKNLLERFQSET
jgi:hypothetical protein